VRSAGLGAPMPHSSVALVSYDSLARATNQWAQQLGSGSYGNVYAGVLHGERVAVKRFRAKCSDGAVDSFLRECAVAAQVQHANLLRVVAMVRDLRVGRARTRAAWREQWEL